MKESEKYEALQFQQKLQGFIRGGGGIRTPGPRYTDPSLAVKSNRPLWHASELFGARCTQITIPPYRTQSDSAKRAVHRVVGTAHFVMLVTTDYSVSHHMYTPP